MHIDKFLSELYQEEPGSTFTHDGHEYDLNFLLKKTDKSPVFDMDVSDLSWILKHTEVDPKRVRQADLQYPLLVVKWKGKWVVVDGAHRLSKAVKQRVKTLPTRLIRPSDLNKAKIK